MKIKANVEVNSEEILLGFKPEQLLEYIKNNYPSFYRDNIERPATIAANEEASYPTSQWFKGSWTDGYYFLVHVDNGEYILCRLKDGACHRWSSTRLKVNEDGRIPISEFKKYNDEFTPVDLKDVPRQF